MEKYRSLPAPVPEIYVEKPICLEDDEGRRHNILEANPAAEKNAYYIDHYRFKDSLDYFLENKSEILEAIGPIVEIDFVSLEANEFWDSAAFRLGYFSEHGCHFFGMLDRAFPEIGLRSFLPVDAGDWNTWEQAGRPARCRLDSAALLSENISRVRTEVTNAAECRAKSVRNCRG